MKVFKDHIVWWLIIIILTLGVSLITSNNITAMGLIFSALGHFAFAFIVSIFPLLFYWIVKKPLSNEEYMSTFTVAWLILTIANLAVM